MTLVAAAGIDTNPVVCGDLLIPGAERPDSAPDISLAGAVTSVFPPGSDWSVGSSLTSSPKVSMPVLPNCEEHHCRQGIGDE
jgi:hypothetical protein